MWKGRAVRRLRFTGSAFLLVAALHSAHAQHVRGFIGPQFDQALRDGGERVVVSSGGGNRQDAQRAAQYVIRNDVTLIFANQCTSACAEYLLITQDPILLLPGTLIGFHQNPALDFWACEAAGYGADCDPLHARYLQLAKFYNEIGVSHDIWRDQMNALGMTVGRVEGIPSFRLKRNFINEAWFPSSKQLEDLYGRKVTTLGGTLCNDDRDCLQGKINEIYPVGTRLATSFGVMISSGDDRGRQRSLSAHEVSPMP